jgi:hypothetical protein
MKHAFFGLCLSVVLALGITFQVSAKDKTSDKVDRLDGRVQMMNKDNSTITVQKGTMRRQVVYGPDTQFTYRNKPATLADVQEGRRVICLGKYNDKTQLVASRIDVREGK